VPDISMILVAAKALLAWPPALPAMQ
jgi:hypothetical protein